MVERWRPRIDVIIPFLPVDAQHLEGALTSIERQGYDITRVTVAIVADEAGPLTQRLLRTLRKHSMVDVKTDMVEGRQGPNVARNRGLALTSGELVMFMDADSVLAPHAIDSLLEQLTDAPAGVAWVYSDYRRLAVLPPDPNATRIDPASQEPRYQLDHIKPGAYDPGRLRREDYIPMTALVRRDALPETGLDEEAPSCHAWDLWLALSESGLRAHYVAEELFEHMVEVSEGAAARRMRGEEYVREKYGLQAAAMTAVEARLSKPPAAAFDWLGEAKPSGAEGTPSPWGEFGWGDADGSASDQANAGAAEHDESIADTPATESANPWGDFGWGDADSDD